MNNMKKFTPIYQKLLKRSIFTEKQIEYLNDYLIKKEKGIRISSKDLVITINHEKVKKGVYYRVLNQAISNLRKVIYSVILLSYTNMIDITDILKITSHISEISDDEMEKLLKYIDRELSDLVKGR